MKRKIILLSVFVSIAAVAAAQQASMPTPPDVVSSQTAASVNLISYKAWVENQLSTLWASQQQNTAAIAALSGGSTAAGGAFVPYSVPSGYAIPVAAARATGACMMLAPPKCTGWTAMINGGIYSQEIVFGGTGGGNGTFYDYDVVIPQAGTYAIKLDAAITSGTSTFGAHFECPVGTPVGSVTYSNGGSASPTIVTPATLANLPAGPQKLRFVVDSAPAGNNTGAVDWFYVVKQ